MLSKITVGVLLLAASVFYGTGAAESTIEVPRPGQVVLQFVGNPTVHFVMRENVREQGGESEQGLILADYQEQRDLVALAKFSGLNGDVEYEELCGKLRLPSMHAKVLYRGDVLVGAVAYTFSTDIELLPAAFVELGEKLERFGERTSRSLAVEQIERALGMCRDLTSTCDAKIDLASMLFKDILDAAINDKRAIVLGCKAENQVYFDLLMQAACSALRAEGAVRVLVWHEGDLSADQAAWYKRHGFVESWLTADPENETRSSAGEGAAVVVDTEGNAVYPQDQYLFVAPLNARVQVTNYDDARDWAGLQALIVRETRGTISPMELALQRKPFCEGGKVLYEGNEIVAAIAYNYENVSAEQLHDMVYGINASVRVNDVDMLVSLSPEQVEHVAAGFTGMKGRIDGFVVKGSLERSPVVAQLFEAVVEEMREAGVQDISVLADLDNQDFCDLLHSLGFDAMFEGGAVVIDNAGQRRVVPVNFEL